MICLSIPLPRTLIVRLDPADTAPVYGNDASPLLSPWHPETTRPLHHGFYAVRDPADADEPNPEYLDRMAAHWNGVRWSQPIGLHMLQFIDNPLPLMGRRFERRYNRNQCYQWRGLNDASRHMGWGDDRPVPADWAAT